MNENAKQMTNHLGSIFFRMSIVCIILLLSFLTAGFLKFTIIALTIAFDVIIIFGTLGICFLFPELRAVLWKTVDILNGTYFETIMTKINAQIPLIAIISAVVIGLSILFLAFNAKESKGKLIVLSIIVILYILAIVVLNVFAGGAK